MNWLKILKTVVELIPVIGNILAILGKKKAEKKAKKVEEVAKTVISGVEKYAEIKKSIGHATDIKTVIKNIAVSSGVENKLNELVKRYTK